jgi:hypothetical protein
VRAPVLWAWWVKLIVLPIFLGAMLLAVVLMPFYWGYVILRKLAGRG